MDTRILNVVGSEGYEHAIGEAADVLNAGGLVVFPTETVYGVGARADRSEALERLDRLKERPDDKPFTVHIGRRGDYQRFVPSISAVGRRFVKKAWPGPLTLVLSVDDPRRAPLAGELDAAGLAAIYHKGTVGLRCPDDRAAADLLVRSGGPVVAASANLAGKAPPRTVEEALADLDGRVEVALAGGPARFARPSTILRVNGDGYELLRDGVYDARMLAGFATLTILFVCTGNTCRSPMALGIARRLIAERLGCAEGELEDRRVEILSAGASAADGAPPADHAVAVLAERGMDISDHRSSRLTVERIQRADHIYAMTESHRLAVVEMVGSAADRTYRLLDDEDIPDPIGGDRAAYAEAAATIERALRSRLEEIEL